MKRRDFFKAFGAAAVVSSQGAYLLSRRPPPGEAEVRESAEWLARRLQEQMTDIILGRTPRMPNGLSMAEVHERWRKQMDGYISFKLPISMHWTPSIVVET